MPKPLTEGGVRVLDVVTNGINHWMVWSVSGGSEETMLPKILVVPVIMNEGGEVAHICFDWRGEYWLNKTIESIRPYWRRVGQNSQAHQAELEAYKKGVREGVEKIDLHTHSDGHNYGAEKMREAVLALLDDCIYF